MASNLTGNEEKETQPKVKDVGKNTAKTAREAGKSLQTLRHQQMIYVGPNLPGGRLSRFTVFREGVPQYLDDVLEQQPAVKSLIIPVNEMSAALNRVGTAGTLEHRAFEELSRKEGK